MNQVILIRHLKPEKLELLGIERDKERAAERVSFYIYHSEGRHTGANMISANTPIFCERGQYNIWFESLTNFNQRLR